MPAHALAARARTAVGVAIWRRAARMVAACGPRIAREDVNALLPAAVSAVRARRGEEGTEDYGDNDDEGDDPEDYDMPTQARAISLARAPPAHDLHSWGGDAEPADGPGEVERAALRSERRPLCPDEAAPAPRAPGTRAPDFFAALRLVYGRGPPPCPRHAAPIGEGDDVGEWDLQPT